MIFATNNNKKLKQIKDLAQNLKILGLKEYGIEIDVEEDGTTFEENAIKKAKEIHALTGESVIADDSGLCIDFFDGWPGVYTHRFLPNSTSSERNKAIIEKLLNVDDNLRSAKVVCVLALCDKQGKIYTYHGEINCKIGYEEKGENLFGFDPIVVLPSGKTLAELTDEEKEKVNARSIAFKMLIKDIENKNIDIS